MAKIRLTKRELNDLYDELPRKTNIYSAWYKQSFNKQIGCDDEAKWGFFGDADSDVWFVIKGVKVSDFYYQEGDSVKLKPKNRIIDSVHRYVNSKLGISA